MNYYHRKWKMQFEKSYWMFCDEKQYFTLRTNIAVAIPFSLLSSKHIKCIKSDGIHVELCEMRKNGIGCYLPDFSAYVKSCNKKSHSRIDLMIFPSNSWYFLFPFLSLSLSFCLMRNVCLIGNFPFDSTLLPYILFLHV